MAHHASPEASPTTANQPPPPPTPRPASSAKEEEREAGKPFHPSSPSLVPGPLPAPPFGQQEGIRPKGKAASPTGRAWHCPRSAQLCPRPYMGSLPWKGKLLLPRRSLSTGRATAAGRGTVHVNSQGTMAGVGGSWISCSL